MADDLVDDFSGDDDSSLWYEDDSVNLDLFFSISMVLSVVLILVALMANGFVCWVLLRGKRFLKRFANFHLLNLVLTDFIFRTLVAPFAAYLEVSELPFGSDALCKVAALGNYTTLAVTFTLLAGIALDRYVHIAFPLKARMLNWKHSRNIVLVTWVYAFACSGSFLFSAKYHKIAWNSTNQSRGICIFPEGVGFQTSTTVFFICAFLAPLGVMGYAYVNILRVLFKREKSKLINTTIAKAKLQAVKMMMLVVATYIFSWGPMLTLNLLRSYGYFDVYSCEDETEGCDITRYLIVDTTFYVLSLTSSVVNPLLFGYYSPIFRQDLKKLCCKRICCTSHGQANQLDDRKSRHERLNLVHRTSRTLVSRL